MCARVCVSVACGEVCIYACMHGPRGCVDVVYLDQAIHTHTCRQLAANEVADKHAAALRPDTEADERMPEPPLLSNEDL